VTSAPPPSPVAPELDIERLYAEYLPRVHGFALRMLGDGEAALDVAQDTFTAAFARRESFRGESAPLTWLLSIARNLCLKRLSRAQGRKFEDFEAVMAYAQEPSPDHPASELSLYVEEVKEGCLVGLLQCLPVTQRCVFVLHLLNDVPIADIARIMDKSENSVRILLSRARSRMRAFLCENCSLLGGTKCACANMVEFSLKRDLIAASRPRPGVDQIKFELRRFADEVELYKSLPERDRTLTRAIEGGRYAIFTAG
jgi:RNA polymerase sigma-70 factor (ECF subfamily)